MAPRFDLLTYFQSSLYYHLNIFAYVNKNREARIKKCQPNASHRNILLQVTALEKAIYSHLKQQQQGGQQSERLILPHDEDSLVEQLRRLQNRLMQQRLRGHSKLSLRDNNRSSNQATR